MHQEKCKTIFEEEDYSSKNNTKHFFLATLPLHKISVIRDWYLIQKIFFGDGCIAVRMCVPVYHLGFLSIEKYYKIIVFILYIKCCCCKLTKRFLFLSQKMTTIMLLWWVIDDASWWKTGILTVLFGSFLPIQTIIKVIIKQSIVNQSFP